MDKVLSCRRTFVPLCVFCQNPADSRRTHTPFGHLWHVSALVVHYNPLALISKGTQQKTITSRNINVTRILIYWINSFQVTTWKRQGAHTQPYSVLSPLSPCVSSRGVQALGLTLVYTVPHFKQWLTEGISCQNTRLLEKKTAGCSTSVFLCQKLCVSDLKQASLCTD